MYLIFVSSLNMNMQMALTLQKQLESLGKKSEIINLVELEFPMYDSFKEENDGIPQITYELVEKMKKADGYIVVSPEYNYSIPPVLTNVIAWISRIGDDFRAVFNEKVILLATFSGGNGNEVLNAMRTQFTKLGSIVVSREILATYQQALDEQSSLKSIKQFIKFAS